MGGGGGGGRGQGAQFCLEMAKIGVKPVSRRSGDASYKYLVDQKPYFDKGTLFGLVTL